MKVALIVPGFSANPTDWAIPALQNLVHRLADVHTLTVFSLRYPQKGLYHFKQVPHIAIGGQQRFGPHSLLTWLAAMLAIIRQHRRTPFDLLHAFWADEAGFVAAMAGKIIYRPVVVSIGGGELARLPDIQYGAQRFLSRRLNSQLALRQAAWVTAGSAYQLTQCHRHGVSATRSTIAPLGIDTDVFRPLSATGQSLPAPEMIQAASLLPVKNQTLLLTTLASVMRHRPNTRLRLAGDGPLQDSLHQLANQLNLSQNIDWYRRLPYREMPLFFQQPGIYVQTSRHESQGMAVLEAMACGTPALGTPVGVMPEAACMPPQVDPDALAQQVLTLMEDPAGYAAFSRQARQTVLQNYSLPVTTAGFLEIYARLL
jgi:glycosyltransferase involved in cell wall biosynthesis